MDKRWDGHERPNAAHGRNQYVGRALLPVAFQTGKSAHPTENSHTLRKLEPLVTREGTKRRPHFFSCMVVFFVARLLTA
jgi:hypothetical protein